MGSELSVAHSKFLSSKELREENYSFRLFLAVRMILQPPSVNILHTDTVQYIHSLQTPKHEVFFLSKNQPCNTEIYMYLAKQ